MKIFCLAILGLSLALAVEMPSGYFRGGMVGFEGSKASGTLRVKNMAGEVFSCAFDAKSYMEFEKQRVTVDKLREGDPLEVLAYRRAGETTCYVLSLQVVPTPILTRPAKRIDVTPTKTIRPAPVRHGNQNFAGVVTEITATSVTVKTRTEERTFLLRTDTRFFGNGLKMDATDVSVNQHLAVEAGRNLEGQLEVFQLTWGEITVP
jgi:hypothetical protein